MKNFKIFLFSATAVIISAVLYLNLYETQEIPCTRTFKITGRSAWKANPPLDSADLYVYRDSLNAVLKHIVIHHSAFSGNFGVKNLQKYQQDNGFNDIAYHFVITKDGSIFDGRPINQLGAHAGETMEASELAYKIRKHRSDLSIMKALRLDPDFGSLGICLDGNFEKEVMTNCQVISLKNLLKYLMKKYNIDKNNIMLHKDVRQKLILNGNLTPLKPETKCPGKNGEMKIREVISLL